MWIWTIEVFYNIKFEINENFDINCLVLANKYYAKLITSFAYKINERVDIPSLIHVKMSKRFYLNEKFRFPDIFLAKGLCMYLQENRRVSYFLSLIMCTLGWSSLRIPHNNIFCKQFTRYSKICYYLRNNPLNLW